MRKFQAILMRKTLNPGHQLAFIIPASAFQQRSKELWWLVRVGVLSQNECLL